MTIYTPFGYSEWRGIIEKIKAFGSEGKKTAVISTINGDANTYFYKELAAQKVDASIIPVMAFSVGERELLGVDAIHLIGQHGGLELLPICQVTRKRSVHQDVDGLQRAARQNHE